MEVTLLSRPSLSEDTLVSVRAGNVRRQTPINSDKPLRFPKQARTESLLHFDILQKVTSGYVVLKPGNEQYRVAFGEGADIACDVSVKTGLESHNERSPEEDIATAKGVDADDARAYLQSTGVLDFVQALLQVVIKEKPKDPYAFMSSHFSCGFDNAAKGEMRQVEIVGGVAAKEKKEKTMSPTGSPMTPPKTSPPEAAKRHKIREERREEIATMMDGCDREVELEQPRWKLLAVDPKVEAAPPPEKKSAEGAAASQQDEKPKVAEVKEGKPPEENKMEVGSTSTAKEIMSLRYQAGGLLQGACEQGTLEDALLRAKYRVEARIRLEADEAADALREAVAEREREQRQALRDAAREALEKAAVNLDGLRTPAGKNNTGFAAYYKENFRTAAPSEGLFANFPQYRPATAVSKDAIQAVVDQIWETYDTDKNGALDKEEGKKFIQGTVGLLDEEMSEEAYEMVFAGIDENTNALIEKSELVKYIKQMYEQQPPSP